MEEVDRLPAELHWTYHNALERIFTQDKADAQLAMQILRWICLCLEPLRLSQLQEAIAVERGYLANDPDCCKGVGVNYGDTDAPVPLGIASEWEYMEVVRILLEKGADMDGRQLKRPLSIPHLHVDIPR